MSEMQAYLVLGGGLIGGAAASALADKGRAVTVLSRAPAAQRLGAIDWRYGSLHDSLPDSLLAGRRAVIYAAGSIFPATRVESVASALEEQLMPVVALAERAARQGARCFVFLSSGGTVYGNTAIVPTHEAVPTNPINLYGAIKVMTEQALAEVGRRTGMSIVSLRVSNPYGPGQQGSRRLGFVAAAIEAARAGQPVTIWGDGLTTRDFVHLDDVSNAVCLAADYTEGTQVLNIASGREASLLEICRLVGEASGHRLDVRFEEARSVDVRRNVLAVERAAAVIGWQPQVTLEEGIRAMCQAVVG